MSQSKLVLVFLEVEFEKMEEIENIRKIKNSVFAEKNKKIALEQLLSDKKRFSSFSTKFLHSSISTLGIVCILPFKIV